MAPAGQGQTWSDVLCCISCNQVFCSKHLPLNLTCGHVVCDQCACAINPNECPLDEITGEYDVTEYPVNSALLWIATGEECREDRRSHSHLKVVVEVEQCLLSLASYLKRAESERGGTVFSENLSRTMQRKLVSLLCFQLVEEEGRSRALKTCRAMADRIMTEVLLSQQVPSHLSTQLWTAVRARGCQFLGPAMQEDVLKLILLALGQGAPIARKTLVMYVVQMLAEDYPQVSKTCVGHVVQLLYRASCFNVIKRDGESSLMQMKEEFRTYDMLRKEHDAQIVQMALEAGLRISPDQWSSLLYGDLQHRSHMQSIIDKLQSPQAYRQGLEELKAVADRGDYLVALMLPVLHAFVEVHPTHHERIGWSRFLEFIRELNQLVDLYVQYISRRNDSRHRDNQHQGATSNWRHGGGNVAARGGERPMNGAQVHRYKTKMCRDVMAGTICPRGSRCTWAHSEEEMREGQDAARNAACAPAPPLMQQAPLPPQNCGGPQRAPNMPIHMQQHPHQGSMPVPPPPNGPPPMMNRQMGQPMGVAMMQGPPPPVGVAFPQNPPRGPPQVMPAPEMMHMNMMPVVVQSPTHHHPVSLQGPHVVMMPAAANGGMVLAAANPNGGIMPNAMWAPPPPPQQQQQLIMSATSPPQGQGFWVQQPGMMQSENGHLPADDRSYGWPRADCGPFRPDQDTDQLFLKRKEILSRLAPLTLTDDEDCDDTFGHVSYTVASSVLDERVDLFQQQHPVIMMGNQPALELPPIPATFTAVMPSSGQFEDTIMVVGDMSAQQTRPRAASVPRVLVKVTTVLTAGPGCLMTSESAGTATVQSDCTSMRIHDTISQPLATPILQRTQGMVLVAAPLEPSAMSDRLPSVLHAVPTMDPQGVVSNTLDKIVDVKERLNEAEGTPMSCAVSQQLRVELRIAEREMDSLDVRTQASCLLRELHQVDRAIERIESTRPPENE